FRTILRPTLVSHIKSGLEVHGVWPHVVASANQHLSNVRCDQAQKLALVVVQRASFDIQEQSSDFILRVAVKFCGCVQKLAERFEVRLAWAKWHEESLSGCVIVDGERFAFVCDYNGKAWLFVRHWEPPASSLRRCSHSSARLAVISSMRISSNAVRKRFPAVFQSSWRSFARAWIWSMVGM